MSGLLVMSETSICRYLTTTILSIFLLDQALAYPRSNYLKSSYSQFSDDSPQRFRYSNNLDQAKPVWDMGSLDNNEEYQDQDDLYNFQYPDPWNSVEESANNDADYNSQWLTEDEDIRDREQELLNLYYLVESMEKAEEKNNEWAWKNGYKSLKDSREEPSEDLKDQLIEVSSKREEVTSTTSRPATTTSPLTTEATEVASTETTTKAAEEKVVDSKKKGQKEWMMMRPATPIKHQFAMSLEQQLSSHKNDKKTNLSRSKHWSSKDIKKLREQLKMLKDELKQ